MKDNYSSKIKVVDDLTSYGFPYSRINIQELDTLEIKDNYVEFHSIDFSKDMKFEIKDSLFPDNFTGLNFCMTFCLEQFYTKQELKEIIIKEVQSELEKTVQVNELVYNQQIDSMPITINMAGDRLQLLDGYKRLLYVNDESLMNQNVAVKVFRDLNDEDFLTLLYAANYWKATLNDPNILFHDRGVLFSLKQRFGVDYRDYSITDKLYFKSFSLIECLAIYDNINYKKNINEFKVSLGKATYKTPHQYLINDIKQMSIIKDIILADEYKVVPLIRDEVFSHTIALLGTYRRNYPVSKQKEIDFRALLNDIFMSNRVLFHKKRDLSTTVYVCNMFAKNNIDKLIMTKIKEMASTEIDHGNDKDTEESYEI